MTEYIEREAILREIERREALMVGDKLVSVDAMKSFIKNRPAADVAPVVHGQWVDNGIPDSILSGCSVCGFTCGSSSFFYCPKCGAKMDGGDGNSDMT